MSEQTQPKRRGSVRASRPQHDQGADPSDQATAADQATPADPGCPFCQIVSGQLDAQIVLDTPDAVAFRDLNPQAPTHVLVVPRRHEPDIAALARADAPTAAALFLAAGQVAAQEGLSKGYRCVLNTGAGAQQSVFHVHVHVLGGRPMTWPPG